MFGSVFLDSNGNEVIAKSAIRGSRREDYRAMAEEKTVIALCGGRQRRSIMKAILDADVATILVTTRASAEELANEIRR